MMPGLSLLPGLHGLKPYLHFLCSNFKPASCYHQTPDLEILFSAEKPVSSAIVPPPEKFREGLLEKALPEKKLQHASTSSM